MSMDELHVAEHYTAYLEGSLPEPLRGEVEAHLRDCPRCAAELEELRALVTTLRELPDVPVPPDFVRSVCARIPRRRPRLRWWYAPALASSLLTAAVAAIFVVMRLTPTPVYQTADSRAGRMPQAAQKQSHSRHQEKRAVTPSDAARQSNNRQMERDHGTVASGQPVGTVEHYADSAKRGHGTTQPADTPTGAPKPTPGNAAPERVEIAAAPLIVSADKAEADIVMSDTGGVDDVNGLTNDVDGVRIAAVPPTAEAPASKAFRADTVPDSADDAGAMTKSTRSASTALADSPNGPAGPAGASGPIGYSRSAPVPVYWGNLQVIAPEASAGKGDPITVRINGTAKTTLTVDTVQPAGVKERRFTVADSREIAVELPKTTAPVVIKLGIQEDGRADAYYLIVPAPTGRQSTTSVQANTQPLLPSLITLANQSGAYLLCPVSFAETKSSFAVKDISPREALHILAVQSRYRVREAGNVLYIMPER